jgi:hypothetical protein
MTEPAFDKIAPGATEPTLALVGIQAGTVETMTKEGAGTSLVFRLLGRVNGHGPMVAWRVATHPTDITQFLAVINDGARENFPDRAPAADGSQVTREELIELGARAIAPARHRVFRRVAALRTAALVVDAILTRCIVRTRKARRATPDE